VKPVAKAGSEGDQCVVHIRRRERAVHAAVADRARVLGTGHDCAARTSAFSSKSKLTTSQASAATPIDRSRGDARERQRAGTAPYAARTKTGPYGARSCSAVTKRRTSRGS